MHRVGGWLSAGKAATSGHGHAKSLTALDELAQIQDAMSAVTHIMNDDVESAEEQLKKGSSPFHQLGVGVCTFMRATLGFEPEVMREASTALSQAENSAYEQQRRAHRDSNTYRSPIYPPGTEYAVCQAQSQLMSAVVGVLNESLTEAVKSFYKLRKAYITLEGVMEAEKKFLKERSSSSVVSVGSGLSSRAGSIRSGVRGATVESRPPMSKGSSAAASSSSLKVATEAPKSDASRQETELNTGEKSNRTTQDDDDDDDFDFVDAEEDQEKVETPLEYRGHLNIPTNSGGHIALDNAKRNPHIMSSSAPNLPAADENPSDSVPGAITDFEQMTLQDEESPEIDISNFSSHPVDGFILSGSNFCFGMLLLLLSFIPPSFSMLLKIVGFKGDRERGMRMLWQATKFDNIHGAMAGVVLMGYLNGFTNFCDILPSTGEGSYPKDRCKALLVSMRTRYPKSHLWIIEEARMLASEKQLEAAVQFMADAGESPLKQLEALSWFERSLNSMYMHDYAATAISFEKCVSLNNWSHGLYYFICGASYVELYRRTKTTDPTVAKEHAAKAEAYFAKVIPNTGKKKFMARQLPFDVFVIRKIQKWEARAKDWSCTFVDAIGVSPLEEMIYFWNGYKRMRDDHLHVSLANLAWSESDANPHWAKEDLDEKSILVVLRAATLRNMGQTGKAMELLQSDIIPHDRALFKGSLKDDWTAPCARYEMAANLWREVDERGSPAMHGEKLERCRDYLQEVTGWESFGLDARIGMKVTSGKETLRRLGVQC